MGDWTRIYPGWYRSRRDAGLYVGTYCDCSRPRCAFRWAVYRDVGMGPEMLEAFWTMAEAKAGARGWGE